MKSLLSKLIGFSQSDDGAITADWVVLTGLIVGLAFPLVGMVAGGQNILADKISTSVAAKNVDGS